MSLFYPRFYCVGCGERIALPITAEEALRLAHKNDRDRRPGGDGRKL